LALPRGWPSDDSRLRERCVLWQVTQAGHILHEYRTSIYCRDILVSDMMSNTAYVILAMLSDGPKTGYEIKAKVDQSTRFFWAASYGQIYPELRRLTESGLVTAADKAQGRRQRIEYTITEAGHETLLEWLRRPAGVCELRDEGLLKAFFANELEPGEARELIASTEADRQATLAELRELDRLLGDDLDPFKRAVLEYGISLFELQIEWYRQLAETIDELYAIAPRGGGSARAR
jgi:DNA-binding PadR family transcriptional regulator